MTKTPQKTVLLLAALVAASIPCVGAESTNGNGTKPAKPFELFNDVIAQGKNVKVTRAALDEELVNIKASAAARGQTIPPQHMRMLEAQVLERLVGRQILNGRATEADRTNGLDNAKKALENITKNSGGDEALKRQLKTVGMTFDELMVKLNEESIAEAVLQRDIKFDVSDDDVKKFYDENPTKFEQPELVRAAHVLIGTREKDGSEMSDEKKKVQRKLAEDVLKRAKAGDDFAKLAADYSEDPGSKDKGGEYTFPRGQMVPEFEAAAFSLEAGKVSDIVTTQYGYHIIKTLEKKPAKKFSLEESAPDIKQWLKRQGMQKQIPAYMENLKKEAAVEILDKDIKKVIDDQNAAEAEMQKSMDSREPEKAEPKKSEKK